MNRYIAVTQSQALVIDSNGFVLGRYTGGGASAPTLVVSELNFLTLHRGKHGVNLFSFNNYEKAVSCALPEPAAVLAVSPRYLAAGTTSGAILLWDALTGALLARCAALYAPITALSFDTSGAVLVAGGRDGTLAVVAVADLLARVTAAVAPVAAVDAHSYAVTFAAALPGALPGALTLVSTGDDRRVVVTTLETTTDGTYRLRRDRSVDLPFQPVAAVLAPTGTVLYAAGADGAVAAVVLSTGAISVAPRALAGTTCLTISTDGRTLVAGGATGVQYWDCASQNLVRTADLPGVIAVAPCPWAALPSERAVAGLAPAAGPALPPLQQFTSAGAETCEGLRPIKVHVTQPPAVPAIGDLVDEMLAGLAAAPAPGAGVGAGAGGAEKASEDEDIYGDFA